MYTVNGTCKRSFRGPRPPGFLSFHTKKTELDAKGKIRKKREFPQPRLLQLFDSGSQNSKTEINDAVQSTIFILDESAHNMLAIL